MIESANSLVLRGHSSEFGSDDALLEENEHADKQTDRQTDGHDGPLILLLKNLHMQKRIMRKAMY